MNADPEELVTRFQSKGALVDSNLLLLLLIGFYDENLLKDRGFKRVEKYTLDDFRSLVLFLRRFRATVTTPHVLTEVSNLAGQLPEHRKLDCFRQFIAVLKQFTELSSNSFASAERPEFPYLGLTDCVIADAAVKYLVITDDLRFWAKLQRAELPALNFNHIRTLGW